MVGNVKQLINKKGWNIACDMPPISRWMNVDITFYDKSNLQNEVQFSISSFNVEELNELFKDFCKNNGFPTNKVVSVTIVLMADTYQELLEKERKGEVL